MTTAFTSHPYCSKHLLSHTETLPASINQPVVVVDVSLDGRNVCGRGAGSEGDMMT